MASLVVALDFLAVAVAWVAAVWWTFRDTTRRGSDRRFAWTALVAVSFVWGLSLYLLVRLPWAVRHAGREGSA